MLAADARVEGLLGNYDPHEFVNSIITWIYVDNHIFGDAY